MERLQMALSQITQHALAVYESVNLNNSDWLTAREIAESTGIAARTVRHHCHQLAELGVFTCLTTFGGFRYRIAEQPPAELVEQLEMAKSVLGTKLKQEV
jgi:predicted DNA-binding transcriptional regulator